MEKKKLIRLGVVVLIVIVALIIIENSIKGIGTLVENNKENKRLEEEREKYESSEKYKEEQMLEVSVEDILKLLNSNETDLIYNLIDADYKDYKFKNDKALFEEYIKKYINNYSDISLQTYQKVNGKYVCRLLSEYNGEYKSFVVLIGKNEDDSYNLIFDDITGIEKVGSEYNLTNNIKCEILYTVTAKKTCVYSINYTNLSNKNINYTYDKIELKDTFGSRFLASTKDLKIDLKPGESMRQDIVFYDSRIHNYPKTTLSLDLKDTNGNIINPSIYLESSM